MGHLLHTHALLAALPLVPSLGSDGALPLKASSFSSHPFLLIQGFGVFIEI
jgi:hypothetical protein